MAALQCPDCGHRELLDALGDVATFRCGGCGRALKVPAQFRQPQPVVAATSAVATPTGVAASSAMRTSVSTVVPPAPSLDDETPEIPVRDWREEFPIGRGKADAAPPSGALPWWARGLIWCVALPLSLAVVFRSAQHFGWLTRDDLINTFVEDGWHSFVPVARLLPFAALLTALIVQLTVTALETWRRVRRVAATAATAAKVQRERPTGS